MIDWPTIQAALLVIARTGSGLDPTQVYWADQGGPNIGVPRLVLRAPSVRKLGRDWVVITDGILRLGQPIPGAEINYSVQGPRRLSLELRTYAGGALTPAIAPLEQLISSLTLPSQVTRLQQAQISYLGESDLTSVSAIKNADFEAQAIVTLRLLVPSIHTETATIIDTVQIPRMT